MNKFGWLGLRKPRTDHDAPFFFKECRLLFLALSILYNFIRLVFESIFADTSVPLIVVRIFINVLILLEQRWMCANWHAFFIQKKIRTYLWFRMFTTLSLMFVITGIRECASYVRWKEMVFYIVGALQFQGWYYWGKGCHFRWEDMRDDRRMSALRNGIICSAIIDIIYFFYSWKFNGFAFTLIIAVLGLLFLALVVHLIIVRDRNNTLAYFNAHASSLHPPRVAVVSEQSQNDNDHDLDLEDGREEERDGNNTAEDNATNDMINSSQTSKKHNPDVVDRSEDGKENDNADNSLLFSITAATNDNQPKATTMDITIKEDKREDGKEKDNTDFLLSFQTATNDKNKSRTPRLLTSIRVADLSGKICQESNPPSPPPSPVAAAAITATDNTTNLLRKKPERRSLTLGSLTALSTQKSVSVPDHFRESLERRIEYQNASHLMVDKIATLIPQILFWFMVVMSAEVGFIIVYGPPSISTWQWCNDFIYSNPYTGPQTLVDMVTRR